MKKILVLIILLLSVIVFYPKKVNLSDLYYKEGKIIEITSNELDELIASKNSFLLFVDEPLCTTSKDFANVLENYTNDHNLTFYKIKFTDMKKIINTVKYYPSLVVFKNGKIKKYLDASKETDLKYYETSENLNKWVNKYVKNVS